MADEVLLLNFQGEDGATGWVDEAQDLEPWGVYADPCEIDTDQHYTGVSSLLMVDGEVVYQVPGITSTNVLYKAIFRYTGASIDFGTYLQCYPADKYGEGGFLFLNIAGNDEDGIYWDAYFIDREETEVFNIHGGPITCDPDTWHEMDLKVLGRTVTVLLDSVEIHSADSDIDDPIADAGIIMFGNGIAGSLWMGAIAVGPNPYAGESILVPSTSMQLMSLAPAYNVFAVPSASMTLVSHAPMRCAQIPAADARLIAIAPDFGVLSCSVPAAAATLMPQNPSSVWSIPRDRLAGAVRIYILGLSDRDGITGTQISGEAISGVQSSLAHGYVIPGTVSMTGYVLTSEKLLAPWYAQDDGAGRMTGPGGVYLGTIDYETGAYHVGLGAFIFGPTTASYQYRADDVATPCDIEIPMSSFQLRLRNGDPTYLSCVIPNSLAYADVIQALSGGQISIRAGYQLANGDRQLEQIVWVDFESLAIDRGDRSDSATLVGHKTMTYTSPKEREISGVSYYGLQADGTRRLRAPVDAFLRPGDTVIYNNGQGEDSFVVGEIEYIVDTKLAYMEVTEEAGA